MRIRKLTLENIKLLANQTFDFGAGPGGWTMLLGENGLCKTTILQTVAIVTAGDQLARALVDDAQDFVRVDRLNITASIRAEIADAQGKPFSVELIVPSGSHAFESRPSRPPRFDLNAVRGKRASGFFIAAYGVGRYLPRRGEVAVPADPVKARVDGVFDQHHKMLGVDFFEALKEKKLHLKYAQALRDVLVARSNVGDRLLPLLDDVELRGQNGLNALSKLLESRRFMMDLGADRLKLPAHQLSQGYQSMIAWIADLLGHAFLENGEVSAKELRGVVLLDEIDLHLHPTWQRVLVPLLRGAFPLVQFIATTHSPLVLAGCEASEVLELSLGEAGVEHRRAVEEPGLKTSSDLFETFFHVSHAARPELLDAYRKLLELEANPKRTQRQEDERKRIAKKLAPYRASATPRPFLDPRSIANEAHARNGARK